MKRSIGGKEGKQSGRGVKGFFFSLGAACHVTRVVTELGPISYGASATQRLFGGAFEKYRDGSGIQLLKLLASILSRQ